MPGEEHLSRDLVADELEYLAKHPDQAHGLPEWAAARLFSAAAKFIKGGKDE